MGRARVFDELAQGPGICSDGIKPAPQPNFAFGEDKTET